MNENEFFKYRDYWRTVAEEDMVVLADKDIEYAGSWKKRGGVGAFMMLARKWDRIEEAMTRVGYDIIEAGVKDQRDEGILDDIQDLRRYLINIESEIRAKRDGQQEEPKIKFPPDALVGPSV